MRSRRRSIALLAAVVPLVAGCGAAPSTPVADRSAAVSGPARPSAQPPTTSSALAVPSSSSGPTVLAARITDALATVAHGGAGTPDVRRAALLEQTTARDLARAPQQRSRRVLARLAPAARAQLTADIHAARELIAMTTPQPQLPQWRILTPPDPTALLADYHRAERETGTPWEYLAAVHLVESRMGRIRGTSTAGAQGPMQFLPATFARYGKGGDINDPADAILAAGRMLAANGAPGDMHGALWSYNHSSRYVNAVATYAEQMRRSPAAYELYWHWQVLYRSVNGTMLLPEGYPTAKPEKIAAP